MGILSYRLKLPIHVIEFVLIHVVLGVSAARLFMSNVPRTRATTMGLGFSAKSLMFIFYQLGTTYVKKLQRWKSIKAYTIINGMEVVFWAALCYITAQANTRQCEGTACILSWIVFGAGIALALFSLWAFAICFVHFRELKQGTSQHQDDIPVSERRHEYGSHSIPMESTSRQWSPSDSSVEHVRK